MKKVIYNGRYPNVSAGGVSFDRGVASDVADELAEKLVKDPEFVLAPEAPKAALKKPGSVPVPAK